MSIAKGHGDAVIARLNSGAQSSRGAAYYEIVFATPSGEPLDRKTRELASQTCNQAEYSALIGALEWAVEHGTEVFTIISANEVLVKQIRGEYKVKDWALQQMLMKAAAMIEQIPVFTIQYGRREHKADGRRLRTKRNGLRYAPRTLDHPALSEVHVQEP